MYYEEKIINGVLCFRNSKSKEFRPYSPEGLTQRIEQLEKALNKTESELDAIKENIAKFANTLLKVD